MKQGFYGGYMGNAGALDDPVYRGEPAQMMPLPYYGGGMNIQQLAGSPGYFMPEAEIQRRFQERYKNTPEGQRLQENILRVREQLKTGTFPWQQAEGSPNSQFYMGPQSGQIPAGFDGKYVS